MKYVIIPTKQEIEEKLKKVDVSLKDELLLLERNFKVSEAEILVIKSGEHQNELKIYIEIKTESRRYDDFDWKPSLGNENALIADDCVFNELEEKPFIWESQILEDDDWNAGILYVFEHNGISYSKIEFVEMLDLDKVRVRWSGLAHILWNDEYNTNVPFKCDCTARIKNKIS